MVKGVTISIVYDWDALLDFRSVAVIVNGKLPALVGVPLIVPLALPSETPGGRVPLLDQTHPPEHPLAVNVAEYAVPTTPLGRLAGVIIIAALAPPTAPDSKATKNTEWRSRTQLQCSILSITVQVPKNTALDTAWPIVQTAE